MQLKKCGFHEFFKIFINWMELTRFAILGFVRILGLFVIGGFFFFKFGLLFRGASEASGAHLGTSGFVFAERAKRAEPTRKLSGLFEVWVCSYFFWGFGLLFFRRERSERSPLGNFWVCSYFLDLICCFPLSLLSLLVILQCVILLCYFDV